MPGNDASLHRGGESRAGDGMASLVELAEEQQLGQQAASVAHLQPLWSLGMATCFSCSVFAAH